MSPKIHAIIFHSSYFRMTNGEIGLWRNLICIVFVDGQIAFASWPFAIRKLPLKTGVLKMTVKSLGGFHILVKLQDWSCKLKNELIQNHCLISPRFYETPTLCFHCFCWQWQLVFCSINPSQLTAFFVTKNIGWNWVKIVTTFSFKFGCSLSSQKKIMTS